MTDLNIPGGFAKSFKCPCCQNPWNQQEEEPQQHPLQVVDESNDNNNTNTNGLATSVHQTFIACKPCLSNNHGFKGLDPNNFDPTIPIGENFYLWSNGGWKKQNPIPSEYSSWNTFIVLRDLNLERLKDILEELLNTPPPTTPSTPSTKPSSSSSNAATTTPAGTNSSDLDIEKVKTFYSTFMNEKAIDSLLATPIYSILELCGNIIKHPTETFATLHSKYGVNILFALGSMPDKANSEHTIASLYQAGLGLPDRDYYFDIDKKDKRDKYVQYIAKLFDLLKESLQVTSSNSSSSSSSPLSPYLATLQTVNSTTLAEQILSFETQLASNHLTRTACRDPTITYNKISFDEFVQQSTSQTEITWEQYLTYGAEHGPHLPFHWEEYFRLVGKSAEAIGNIINLQSKAYLLKIVSLMNEFSTILPYYAMFHVLNSYANHLSAAWVDTYFQFHEKELKGTLELLVRWKRGLQILESSLGEALGKLYVKKYFPVEAKRKALQIVASVREALKERLIEIPWMSEETKQEAFSKMDKFKVKIGYPDSWKDYSKFVVIPDQHVQNVIASRSFEFQVELDRINAPTDKARWFMTPQTVNAYFHPSLNEIVFPAAILQPPFFDAQADLAVQYGSLGAVVGHEMTHGYDDQGRKYDSSGNLRDWWTKTDGEEYERRAAVMVKQAEKFEVYGLQLNGKLTCGENIADLGGVKLALRALKNHLATLTEPVPLINGLTPLQRFFIAWSQSWRENVKKERAIQLVTIDPHGPNEFRCNGTLSNIAEFYEAFAITEKDRMYIPESERVEIW